MSALPRETDKDNPERTFSKVSFFQFVLETHCPQMLSTEDTRAFPVGKGWGQQG